MEKRKVKSLRLLTGFGNPAFLRFLGLFSVEILIPIKSRITTEAATPPKAAGR
ncbi:MAG: hypothetical protein IPO04_21395 [Cytophagaceae bacterium]|nr:hypothetical protein [Cytophagaceae bacterium]